jgi:bifunctional UDP-N-acetylglucosamine pyrophosphorylase/glucosamine-1-phosphate N-acetyltransferase
VKVVVSRKARQRTEKPGLAIVVLAAGDGTRMRSKVPKVSHELAGKPLVRHVVDVAACLRPDRIIVVVGHGADSVRTKLEGRAECVVQERRLGTGHAVSRAKGSLARFHGEVLVLCGDAPLLRAATLKRLLARHRRNSALATVLSMIAEDPRGYGRIVRRGGLRIVEQSDANASERAISEVNTGTYCFDAKFLFGSLSKLGRSNAQREYYLTDLIAMASAEGRAACDVVADPHEGLGVNSRSDLAAAEEALRKRVVSRWMERGVTFVDPASVTIGVDVRIGIDCTIGPNVVLLGDTRIGRGTRIDGANWLKNTVIDAGVHLRWGSVAEGARIFGGARVGPFAHLRPGALLGTDVHVGNFVEVKNAKIGPRSKANHLSYIGDARVGRDANIGAGTITCNYDGFRKHETVIGDRVQIGSDTQLVAPVTLGADCYVAAGSTVTRDVPAWALVLNAKRQIVRRGWVRSFRSRAAVSDSNRKRKKRG